MMKMRRKEPMDCKTIAGKLGLDEAEFMEVLTLFVQVSESDLQNMESGLRKGNARQVAESAHSIKGAAMNLGIAEISDAASAIETKARRNEVEQAPAAVRLIKEQLDSLNRVIRK
ncbi:MAG: Hpt domain-containing protein [Desulfobacteraceae bacterium]|nr:MAG: Hpt domain-containing protein [Desulfobacteraceae bacterium]